MLYVSMLTASLENYTFNILEKITVNKNGKNVYMRQEI